MELRLRPKTGFFLVVIARGLPGLPVQILPNLFEARPCGLRRKWR
jgi:hypothetical protein